MGDRQNVKDLKHALWELELDFVNHQSFLSRKLKGRVKRTSTLDLSLLLFITPRKGGLTLHFLQMRNLLPQRLHSLPKNIQLKCNRAEIQIQADLTPKSVPFYNNMLECFINTENFPQYTMVS